MAASVLSDASSARRSTSLHVAIFAAANAAGRSVRGEKPPARGNSAHMSAIAKDEPGGRAHLLDRRARSQGQHVLVHDNLSRLVVVGAFRGGPLVCSFIARSVLWCAAHRAFLMWKMTRSAQRAAHRLHDARRREGEERAMAMPFTCSRACGSPAHVLHAGDQARGRADDDGDDRENVDDERAEALNCSRGSERTRAQTAASRRSWWWRTKQRGSAVLGLHFFTPG